MRSRRRAPRTDRNLWVQILDRIATERPAVALITDMRHTNEADRV
jgi:hypothetical protein